MATNKDEGFVYVQLDAYLRNLRAIEKRKPKEHRRVVPTITELSDATGVTYITLWRFAQGRTKSFNLDTASAIMREMWERGFQTEIGDLLNFDPPAHLVPKKNRIDDPWAPPPPPPPPLTRRQRLKYPGEEFVKAYAEASQDSAKCADWGPMQSEMLPEVTEVVRMLTSFPESIQKDAALALKGQLDLVQKTFSFHDQLPQK